MLQWWDQNRLSSVSVTSSDWPVRKSVSVIALEMSLWQQCCCHFFVASSLQWLPWEQTCSKDLFSSCPLVQERDLKERLPWGMGWIQYVGGMGGGRGGVNMRAKVTCPYWTRQLLMTWFRDGRRTYNPHPLNPHNNYYKFTPVSQIL